MAASSDDDDSASDGSVGCASEDDSACSTPFVSAQSSPASDRDTSFPAAFVSAPFGPARDPSFSAAGWFRSVPVSPVRVGAGSGTANEYGRELGFDFAFDLSRCPPPAAAAMSSADELFDKGQIRPKRLMSFLIRPHALPPLDEDVPPPPAAAGAADERGRARSRSSRRRYRSLSPFRARWLSPTPAPAAKPVEPAAGEAEAAQPAWRSSSSSSTASCASLSSSSRSHNRTWRFLKDILHRRKSSAGGGEHPPPPAPRRSPSPSPASRGCARERRSAHARLYESRRAEAEEMRRRTFLPYRHGLPLLGCLGIGSRGYIAMHGLVDAVKARPWRDACRRHPSPP